MRDGVMGLIRGCSEQTFIGFKVFGGREGSKIDNHTNTIEK